MWFNEYGRQHCGIFSIFCASLFHLLYVAPLATNGPRSHLVPQWGAGIQTFYVIAGIRVARKYYGVSSKIFWRFKYTSVAQQVYGKHITSDAAKERAGFNYDQRCKTFYTTETRKRSSPASDYAISQTKP